MSNEVIAKVNLPPKIFSATGFYLISSSCFKPIYIVTFLPQPLRLSSCFTGGIPQ